MNTIPNLDAAPAGSVFAVRAVAADPLVPNRALQLQELGFFPGERVMVVRRGRPGGDPLVVRIGDSTFALRRAEARCVLVAALPAQAAP